MESLKQGVRWLRGLSLQDLLCSVLCVRQRLDGE
jgi:hypothetical protein